MISDWKHLIDGVNEVEYEERNVGLADWQMTGSDAGDGLLSLAQTEYAYITDLLIAIR